jgi:predicted transcriptional regulator of viral defense system
MPERCPSSSSIQNWRGNVRRRKAEIAQIAAAQWGRIRWDQLLSTGVHKSQIAAWVAEGYLHPIHPRVYAVGHTSSSGEAELIAAVFYAGPGAMLSHETAAWWWDLTDREPRSIDVSTPRKCVQPPRGGGQRAVRVHERRRAQRVWHRRLPVTDPSQTLLDFASVAPFARVRYALAEADYQRLLRYDGRGDARSRAARQRDAASRGRQPPPRARLYPQ